MIEDKELILNVMNERDFKKWLISKRWFGNKSFLQDLNFNISLEYFKPLSEHIFIQIITISKNEYTRSYFFPIVCFNSLNEINLMKEDNHENILNIENHFFKGKIFILEAEFCILFWKEILEKLDIALVFKDSESHIFSLKQLGKDNTTNLLFSFQVSNKNDSENPIIIYALKSYKNYSENLEIIKLSILNKNKFGNVPKLFGTFKIKDINVIRIMEVVKNKGNIGDIYWNELNILFHNIFQHQESKDSLPLNIYEYYDLISTYCIESIKIASKIGNLLGPFWKCLIKAENVDYSVVDLNFSEFFSNYEKKLESVSSNIIKNLDKLDDSSFYYQFNKPEVISYIDIVSKINLRLKSEYRDVTLKIQPIHQDLHMEQVLYDKINGDYKFSILDLEGDPQLSIKEKKSKYPIEKDIAYFLRSLSYIKYNTLLNHNENKKYLGSIFLSNNQDNVLKANMLLLDSWELFFKNKILENLNSNKILIELFTIERILNEVSYELQYRPRNLIIPILGLHEFINKHHL